LVVTLFRSGAEGNNEGNLWKLAKVQALYRSRRKAHLHAADTQCKADTEIMTVRPFHREDSVGDEKKDTKR